MSYEDWPDETMETRLAMIRKTIRPAGIDELMDLGEKHFTVATDPWCIRFSEFLQDNRTAKFHRAEAPGGAEIVYCREREKGVWILPGRGMGIIQAKGLKALAEIVDKL